MPVFMGRLRERLVEEIGVEYSLKPMGFGKVSRG
jgi:hypothetical protein